MDNEIMEAIAKLREEIWNNVEGITSHGAMVGSPEEVVLASISVIQKLKAGQLEPQVGKPFYEDEKIKIYNGNFESVLPQLKENIDVIIADPPYPNYLVEEYKYYDGMLNFLTAFDCKQIIFWTITEQFPLDYTARHSWNKLCGTYATKEFIYERNGANIEYDFNYQKIKNKIDAQMNRDVITGHKSQKPIRLMLDIVSKFTNSDDLIFDPFAGSGSTLLAVKKLGRRAIGIEISERWCEVAAKRLSQKELFT